ncbi:helicase I [Azospirillum thiophilum]|uniref:Helicase I n=1 Tax=Azospirillum thiophilum TaxID=528244 RepID=A0AAC8VVZ2_9PROT|nr:double-strand break repair protein AddB [Azospirillum thiophilum]ALG70395.1 helicase I [Azospirillum thiophilum]KJR65926.1 helicase I [Azospirillum thiophilum]
MTHPKVYSIPSGAPFVDMLAAGIMERVGGDPMALAGVTVLLPTRRACRSLQQAFLRRSGGQPTLLPRMAPLGELDAGDLSLTEEELPDLPLDLPEAISPLSRQMTLARLVLASTLSATTAQAVRLGADLGRLIDAVWTERVGFERLHTLVPDDYAEHWKKTLEFLNIVTEVWPAILESSGETDPAQRRNLALETQAALWQAAPPPGMVIAAGSTGSIVAASDLLSVIARLPQGAMVLPGLDQDADDTIWQAIEQDESHPQHGLSQLIRHLGVERDEVRAWTDVAEPRGARARLIAEAMRPAATTEGWRELSGLDASALTGLTRIDAATSEEEAQVIALLMRHALETPTRTAALITPDRNLGRRVAMALARWGILVNDSGGQPLAHTAVGTYLRLTAELAASRVHPLALLALAKHPMAAGGRDSGDFRAAVRALERVVLRGPRPAEGFDGVLAALEQADRFDHEDQQGFLREWLIDIGRRAAPFLEALNGETPLADLLRAHVAFCEALAADHEQEGKDRLWRQDDGEEAARFLADLLEAAEGFPAIPAKDYPALLDALMSARAVRPRYGLHPRLFILGPMEARLQHLDLTILGGLNEGTWPPAASADPWMSRPMRRDFGLPSPERLVGMSAHDFAHACGAPEVVLTRAARVEGTPTVPSRWLLRLETVLKALDMDGVVEERGAGWLAWARGLDEPDRVQPVGAPEPRPPLSARPRKLSVTEIETWMRDPYAIYARHALRLRALDPIAADPGASDRGQIIHDTLDAFVREHPGPLPHDALDRLIALGRDRFGPLLRSHPDVWAFWWPRFERVAAWFVDLERERRPRLRPLATEVPGRLELSGPGGPFTLTAKADRIDRGPDGLVVIDYKTGTPPGTREIELGFAPQLPLEAAIATAGRFSGIDAAPVAELTFWRLSGGDPAGEEKPVKGDPAALAEEAKAGLEALIARFDDPDTPYRSRPRPAMAPRYTDYAHLARVQEWSAGGGEGEG